MDKQEQLLDFIENVEQRFTGNSQYFYMLNSTLDYYSKALEEIRNKDFNPQKSKECLIKARGGIADFLSVLEKSSPDLLDVFQVFLKSKLETCCQLISAIDDDGDNFES